MFGTIDLPEGGKLPPAPTYLGADGKEHQAVWINVTQIWDPPNRLRFIVGKIDTTGWGRWDASN